MGEFNLSDSGTLLLTPETKRSARRERLRGNEDETGDKLGQNVKFAEVKFDEINGNYEAADKAETEAEKEDLKEKEKAKAIKFFLKLASVIDDLPAKVALLKEKWGTGPFQDGLVTKGNRDEKSLDWKLEEFEEQVDAWEKTKGKVEGFPYDEIMEVPKKRSITPTREPNIKISFVSPEEVDAVENSNKEILSYLQESTGESAQDFDQAVNILNLVRRSKVDAVGGRALEGQRADNSALHNENILLSQVRTGRGSIMTPTNKLDTLNFWIETLDTGGEEGAIRKEFLGKFKEEVLDRVVEISKMSGGDEQNAEVVDLVASIEGIEREIYQKIVKTMHSMDSPERRAPKVKPHYSSQRLDEKRALTIVKYGDPMPLVVDSSVPLTAAEQEADRNRREAANAAAAKEAEKKAAEEAERLAAEDAKKVAAEKEQERVAAEAAQRVKRRANEKAAREARRKAKLERERKEAEEADRKREALETERKAADEAAIQKLAEYDALKAAEKAAEEEAMKRAADESESEPEPEHPLNKFESSFKRFRVDHGIEVRKRFEGELGGFVDTLNKEFLPYLPDNVDPARFLAIALEVARSYVPDQKKEESHTLSVHELPILKMLRFESTHGQKGLFLRMNIINVIMGVYNKLDDSQLPGSEDIKSGVSKGESLDAISRLYSSSDLLYPDEVESMRQEDRKLAEEHYKKEQARVNHNRKEYERMMDPKIYKKYQAMHLRIKELEAEIEKATNEGREADITALKLEYDPLKRQDYDLREPGRSGMSFYAHVESIENDQERINQLRQEKLELIEGDLYSTNEIYFHKIAQQMGVLANDVIKNSKLFFENVPEGFPTRYRKGKRMERKDIEAFMT